MITSIKDNKVYIGSAAYYSSRMHTHLYWLRKGEHDNPYLQSVFNKYGQYNLVFSILEYVSHKEHLIEREQYWIDHFHSYKRTLGFNLCRHAASRLGQIMSKEAREKIGNFWRGKKHSQERKDQTKKRSQILYGKKVIATDKNNVSTEYSSISEACRQTGTAIATISKQCSGLKQGRKITFRYKDIV